MLQNKTAVKISAAWHGGQWTALYSFASTQQFYGEKSLVYLWEIMQCLQNEHFAPYPHELTNVEKNELNSLKEYFEEQIRKTTFIEIEYKQHKTYGYSYPDAITGFESFVNFESIHLPN
jgi:hypothetical protein